MGNGYSGCMMINYPKRFLQTTGGSTTSKLPADLQPWDEMGNGMLGDVGLNASESKNKRLNQNCHIKKK